MDRKEKVLQLIDVCTDELNSSDEYEDEDVIAFIVSMAMTYADRSLDYGEGVEVNEGAIEFYLAKSNMPDPEDTIH